MSKDRLLKRQRTVESEMVREGPQRWREVIAMEIPDLLGALREAGLYDDKGSEVLKRCLAHFAILRPDFSGGQCTVHAP